MRTVISKTELALNVSDKHSQKQLSVLISRRHPMYDELLPHWNFLQETYDGGREWFKDNIFKYLKEGSSEYSDRIERAYRFNHTREVVDLVNKYLFKQEIVRNEADAQDYLLRFWKNSTKSGLSINDLARQISLKTSQLGRVAIVVDNTGIHHQIHSVADEKKANFRTFAYIVPPQQILDYSYDEYGDLNWILLQEIGRDDTDPFLSTGEKVLSYRLWTRTSWALYEEEISKVKGSKKINLKASGNHDLGEVPVVLANNTIDDADYKSTSLIDDIAYLDRAVANYLSNLDAIIQDQTFSQLAIPAQSVSNADEVTSKILEMGTRRLFTYDSEGNNHPFYLSPDVKQANLIITAINKIINEIYHTVGLAGERTKQDNAIGIDNSSGVAKAYDFERVNALLSSKAHSLELVERKIANLVMKWHGDEPLDDGLISYPDNFDTRSLYDEFDIAERLLLIEAPTEIRKHQMTTVAKKLFPQCSKKDAKSIDDDIDEFFKFKKTLINALKASQQVAETTNSTKPKSKSVKSNRQGQVTSETGE